MRNQFSIIAMFMFLFVSHFAEAQSLRISGFTDLSLGSWLGAGDLQNEGSLCVYNLGNPNYQVRPSGSGSGSAFTLSGGGTTISYEVYFKESGGSYIQLTSGSRSSFTNAHTTSDTCGGVENAKIKVVATAAVLGAAPAANYSGTLSILLETR